MLLALLGALAACAVPADEATAALAPGRDARLTLYTSHKQAVYGPIVKEFQEETGIWVEVITGGTNELLERIAAEAEQPVCDVMFGGGVESLCAYESCFEPYACAGADRLREGLRPEGDAWTPFSSLPLVFIYNPKLVEPDQLTGWADLIDLRWKGKIAFADPTVSGSSYTAALTLLSCLPGDDWELLEQFAANLDGDILADSGDVVGAVANGSRYLGVTLEETALKGLDQGAEIAVFLPTEGTSAVPDGSALVAGAPHAENAKAFLEFVQSRDVQELVVSQFSRRSVRTDVHDPDSLPPVEELDVIDYDVHWAAGLKEEFTARWLALCGEERA
nr:ABC transporter substrate-binding protein [Intestinimonas massiliensis (ex Afouda et al. 2020)]